MLGPINMDHLRSSIRAWLLEDMPHGDITSQNITESRHSVEVQLIAKESGVICGLDVMTMVFQEVDDLIELNYSVKDGDLIHTSQVIGHITGPLASILMGERLALNLLQRMSGIATMSKLYSDEVEDYDTRIVDTRKTTPGLRSLEKYAVRIGGSHNHRFSLSDAVMIKDNHIKAAGGIPTAVKQIRSQIPHTTKIEVEVEDLDGLRTAIEAGADIIMLDNMTNELMTEAVAITDGKAILEASGNMVLERLKGVAQTGVDVISVGALTHSVKALDISLKFK